MNNPESSLNIKWEGPFSLFENQDCESIFSSDKLKSPGLYLWTIPYNDSYLVNYVGISATSILDRLETHIVHYLSGRYTIYDPEKFQNGIKERIYCPSGRVRDFLNNNLPLSQIIFPLLKTFKLLIAPVEQEKRILERIESSIIKILRKDNVACGFLDNQRIIASLWREEKEISVTVEYNALKTFGFTETKITV
ncbi:MAG: hypothetical protein KGZ58_00435 [Ignavibacteriales bacterium]|nr:hypothetical protein [Ignavibacteriales bacterium]